MIPTLQLLTSTKKPTLALASRAGTLYNLTPSNQRDVEIVHLSVGDFLHIKDTISALPENISFKKYIGLKDNVLTYLAPHDYYKAKCMTGCGQQDSIKVFSNKGYTKITQKQYYEMVKLIKPDIWVGFTEMPLLNYEVKELSKKSIMKSIKKSTEFLKLIKDEEKRGLFLAPVHGGSTEHFSASINQVLKYESIIDGVLLCDIADSISNEAIISILNRLKQHVGNKQLIVCLAGAGNISRLRLFTKGIHMFEVNYPFNLAENNQALVKQKQQYIQHSPIQHQTLAPLDADCQCLACTSYSESYIAHLIKCHQMTGNVLLTIHNLHQYSRVQYK